MKEKLYTIPLNDAVNENDECPLCNAVRSLERDAIDFAIGPGASYMESDIREQTDQKGFCKHHFQMMFEYGNSLGNALILKTHVIKFRQDLKKKMNSFQPSKSSLFSKVEQSNVEKYIDDLESQCFVCDYYKNTYKRYIDTFFYLYKEDDSFKQKIENGKGFCLEHMKELVGVASKYMDKNDYTKFCQMLFELQDSNLKRIEEDISWFVDKFDYRYKDADWKNSKDAIPRTIQKIVGGYPADGPYKESK